MDPFLTCRQMADFLGDYYDGTLAAEQRREFERHLAVCPPCIHYLESYKTTIALAQRAHRRTESPSPVAPAPAQPASPAATPPADRAVEVPEELIQAILAARRRASP